MVNNDIKMSMKITGKLWKLTTIEIIATIFTVCSRLPVNVEENSIILIFLNHFPKKLRREIFGIGEIYRVSSCEMLGSANLGGTRAWTLEGS
jgi:hypothetical protein